MHSSASTHGYPSVVRTNMTAPGYSVSLLARGARERRFATVPAMSPARNASAADGPYVALLRAINVGGRNVVAMARLRELLTGLGYGAVRTHLQSGNALFMAGGTPPELVEEEIERGLVDELGVAAKVLVRTRAELERVVAANPLLDVAGDHKRLLV